ncbi:retrovirus-related pol polyprotein from transposon TNT 1-94 [Tanacetum coccineum]
MKKEIDSLRKNKTWELVDHPAGQKLVSCKWLSKIKEWIEGVQNPRYKARLVARGFTQRTGIDYNEVFSELCWFCRGHPSDYGMLSIFGYVAYPHDKQSDKSVEELQVEVELQRLNNHTAEEDQTDQEDGDDEDAGDQATDRPPDLTDY